MASSGASVVKGSRSASTDRCVYRDVRWPILTRARRPSCASRRTVRVLALSSPATSCGVNNAGRFVVPSVSDTGAVDLIVDINSIELAGPRARDKYSAGRPRRRESASGVEEMQRVLAVLRVCIAAPERMTVLAVAEAVGAWFDGAGLRSPVTIDYDQERLERSAANLGAISAVS